jgi:hypothetical protein
MDEPRMVRIGRLFFDGTSGTLEVSGYLEFRPEDTPPIRPILSQKSEGPSEQQPKDR